MRCPPYYLIKGENQRTAVQLTKYNYIVLIINNTDKVTYKSFVLKKANYSQRSPITYELCAVCIFCRPKSKVILQFQLAQEKRWGKAHTVNSISRTPLVTVVSFGLRRYSAYRGFEYLLCIELILDPDFFRIVCNVLMTHLEMNIQEIFWGNLCLCNYFRNYHPKCFVPLTLSDIQALSIKTMT